MIRMPLLALAVLLFTGVLQSQEATRPGSGDANADSAQLIVNGCIEGSDGNYTVTDKSGRTFSLLTYSAQLAAHVGHEVQVTGTTSGPIVMSSGMGTEATGNQLPTLRVQNVKHISATCQGAGAE